MVDYEFPRLFILRQSKEKTIQSKEKTMFIAGSGSLRYGEIIDVIDAAKGAGVDKVGIITEAKKLAGGAAPVGD